MAGMGLDRPPRELDEEGQKRPNKPIFDAQELAEQYHDWAKDQISFKNTEEDGIQVQLPVYDADVHENYHLYIDLIGADQYQIVDTGWLKDEFSDAGYINN